MNKIKRISRLFRLLFQILFYLQPFFTALFWIFVKTPPANAIGIQLPVEPHYFTLNATIRTFGFLVSLIPTAFWMYGLHCLVKLFKNYEQGKIFVLKNALFYRNLGYTICIWFFVRFFYQALISLVVTFQNRPLHKSSIMIGLSNHDILLLIVGGVIILISWVMKEGYKLSEEQSLTV